MTVVSESIKEMSGYKLHIINTGKYKTNTLIWKMKAPLNEEEYTERSLLPHVLQSGSAKYPTTAKLRSFLDELYGASMFVDVSKKGEYQVVSFTIEVANEKFLSDQTPLLEKAFELLVELLVNPHIDGERFDPNTVEREKRTLKQRIQAVYDDKMRYSNLRLIEEMCKGEPYALHVNGDKEKVDQITPESLYNFYKRAFKEDELDLYVIGDIDESNVTSLAEKLLKFENRDPKRLHAEGSMSESDVNEVVEAQDVKQGKLNIGFRTNVVYGDPDYYALQVFNGIYGGFSHSKLFINVREKASLAYYAASRLESHKGLLMVMSGVDFKNYELAVKIIKEQMNAMKDGDFSDQDIEQTKAVIKNQLLETIDTSRGLVEVLYHNIVSKQNISLDEWLEQMQAVSKEDIVKVANKVYLDTVYFLTGTEGGK